MEKSQMDSTATPKKPLSPAVTRSPIARLARKYALQIGTIGVALFIWIIFLIGAPSTFTSFNIYNALLITTPYFGMVAIPLTLVIITGEIDLSFGSIMAWGMTGFDVVYVGVHIPIGSGTIGFEGTHNFWLGFIACLLFGLIAGWINGVIVVKVGVPSLVATIGTQFFWAGAVLVVTNAQGIGLTFLQRSALHEGLVGRIGGAIPMQFIWMILIAVAVWFLLNRTRFGAHVYLTGDNIESARLMGVNVDRIKIICFALVGLAAAFAGFVSSADLLFFWPTMGQGNFLNTLAAVFLGGTSVFGGTGSIFGTFIASFIINAINPGIVAVGLTQYYTQVIYGFIIVASVALQAVLRRRLT
jgi:simple sugar transport system permease protein